MTLKPKELNTYVAAVFTILYLGARKMALEGIVNKQGNLLETFKKLDSNTIQHSDEITKDRIIDENLRNKWFYTADHALYKVEDDEAVLYLGRRETNPIFKNIEKATKELITKSNYIPEKTDIEAVVNAKSTLRIKLSDLNLKKSDDEFSYFEINTSAYEKLNDAQRTFAERVYGQGKDFEKAMEMFKEASISTARIYVLNPKYVKKHVEKDSAVVRACWLSYFGNDSIFDASDRDVDYTGSWLRGVCLSAEGGGAPEKQTQKVVDIDAVLQKAGRLDDYAPAQRVLLRNILRNGGYEIIKKD